MVLVLCQIVSIFLIAWLLEWRSSIKNGHFLGIAGTPR
jgi:hypothetical protein